MLLSLVDTEGELSVLCVNGNVWRRSHRKTATVRFGRLVGGGIEINKDETHPKDYHNVVFFPPWWRWNKLSALTAEVVRGEKEMAARVNASPHAGVKERECLTRIMLSLLCTLDNGGRLSPGFQMEVTIRAAAHSLL